MTIVNMVGGSGKDGKIPSSVGNVGTGVDCLIGTGSKTFTSTTGPVMTVFCWTPTGTIINISVNNRPIKGQIDSDGNVISTINAAYVSTKPSGSEYTYYKKYIGNGVVNVPSGTEGTATYNFTNRNVIITAIASPTIPTVANLTSATNNCDTIRSIGDAEPRIFKGHVNESGKLVLDENVEWNFTSWYSDGYGDVPEFGLIVISLSILD